MRRAALLSLAASTCQGDSASGCGITPIIRHNGNKFSVAPKDCASRLMIQRIKESGTKNCPTCSNG